MTTKKPRGPKAIVIVTEDIIEAAIPRDSSHCMIAEAIKKAFPGARNVSVDLQTIRFTDPEKPLRYTYLTPRPAAVALVNFDSGEKPEPFAVRLHGAHVTASGAKPKNAKRLLSEEEIAQRRAAAKASLSRQTLRSEGSEHDVPRRVGGRPPPVLRTKTAEGKSIPFPRRREFGQRAFVR